MLDSACLPKTAPLRMSRLPLALGDARTCKYYAAALTLLALGDVRHRYDVCTSVGSPSHGRGDTWDAWDWWESLPDRCGFVAGVAIRRAAGGCGFVAGR